MDVLNKSMVAAGGSAWRQGLAVAAASLILGLDSIGFAVALATLMYSGVLANGLAMGITAVLACSIILSLTVGTFSQLRTNISGAQDIGVAVLAVTLAASVSGLGADARLPTAFAIVAAATLATGMLMLIVGLLKAGRFVRYFPLEVLAGFMAATGFLLVTGGIAIVSGVSGDIWGVLSIRNADQVLRLVPALALAATIYVTMTRIGKPYLLLVILLSAIAVFHILRLVLGFSMEDAALAQWLPIVPHVSGVAFAFPSMIENIDWSTVFSMTPTIMTVAAISLFAALLNISALEFATGQDLDLDREMRLTGAANMLVGGVGGPPGFSYISFSLLFQKFGITTRGLGVSVAAFQFVGLWFATEIAGAVPTFVAGGLVLYLGFDLVKDWLIATRTSYSRREWSVVALIVVISVFHSFLLAIIAGFLIATVLFAYSYANSPVVRSTTDLASLPSTMERSRELRQWLTETGQAVRVFRLQGFLFFGTSEQVFAQIKQAVTEASGLRAVVIDFARVTEMDSASANTFKRIASLAELKNFVVIFSSANASVVEALRRTEIMPGVGLHFAPDLDRALIEAESLLLDDINMPPAEQDLATRLATTIGERNQLVTLFAEMTRKRHPSGAHIIAAGTIADEVFFIEAGQAVVERRLDNGNQLRLRTMLPGSILGDVAYSLGGLRTADVVAETQTDTLSITAAQVAKLETLKPALALLFKSLLNRALAEKVITANRMTEHAG